MSPRRANPGAHEALVEAARDEFARRGVDGARIEDIARRAGLSKGAFYLHFPSKEAALREILLRFLGVLEDLESRREDAVVAATDVRTDAAAIVEQEWASDVEFLEALWRNRKILAALDGASAGCAGPLVVDFRRRMRALVAARLERRQRRGWLRSDLEPETLGDVVMGAYEAFGRRMVDLREKPDLAAWARSFLSIFYPGALASVPGAGPASPTES